MRAHLIACLLLLGPTTAAAEEPLALSGKIVLLTDNRPPMEGVRVLLEPWLDGYQQGVRQLLGQPPVEPVDTATSGPQGLFELRAPDFRIWALRVTVDGYRPIYRRLGAFTHPENLGHIVLEPCEDCEPRPKIDTASPPTTRRLQILDAEGAPVPRALLARGDTPLALTDAEGWADLPETDQLRGKIRIRLADGQDYNPRLPPDGEQILQLPPPLRIEETVIDKVTGRPLADALIWCLQDDRPAARSDADGRFSWYFRKFPCRGILAAKMGYHRGSVLIISTVKLRPLTTLEGTVVDPAGRGVEKAQVHLRRPSLSGTPGEPSLEATTDGSGNFRFDDFHPGMQGWTAQASAPGYSPALEITPEKSPLHFVLEPGVSLAGQTVAGEGQPVAGVEVTAFHRTPKETPRIARVTARSDAEGRFLLGPLHPGRFELLLLAEGFAPTHPAELTVPSGDHLLDLGEILLEPDVVLEGIVHDLSGHPVAETTVTLSSRATIWQQQEQDLHPYVETAADGSFRFTGIDTRYSWSLALEHPEYINHSFEIEPFPPESPLQVPLYPGASIRGRVLDEEGNPVAEASILVTVEHDLEAGRRKTSFRPEKTTTDGSFHASGIGAGTVLLRVGGLRDYLETSREFEIQGLEHIEGVEVILRRGHTLEGLVVDSGGAPAPRVKISAVYREDPYKHLDRTAETDFKGRFVIKNLPPGPLLLIADHTELGVNSISIERIPDKPVHLRLVPRLILRGRVLSKETGQPLTGVKIELLQKQKRWFSFTGQDGIFLANPEYLGPFRLRVSHPGYQPHEIELDTDADPTEEILLHLSRDL